MFLKAFRNKHIFKINKTNMKKKSLKYAAMDTYIKKCIQILSVVETQS